MIRSFMPITLGSALGFQCFNSALNRDFLPAPCGKYAASERHRWRNAVTSLVNSVIIAGIVVYSLLSDPRLYDRPVMHYTVSADVCFAVLSGYLIYDTFDLLLHSNFMNVWSVVVHHVIVNFLLFILSSEERGFGIAIIGLLCEFSGAFLHSRLLLLMYGFPKTSLVFILHKVFNLSTFVLLRLVPMAYACYVTTTSVHLPGYMTAIFSPALFVVFVINCILLWRVIVSDVLRNSNRDVIMDN